MQTPRKKKRTVLTGQDKENIFFIKNSTMDSNKNSMKSNKENINNLNFMKKISMNSKREKAFQTTNLSTNTSQRNLNRMKSKKSSILKESKRQMSKPQLKSKNVKKVVLETN
jgi:predicted P-loop ATPase/GTPase